MLGIIHNIDSWTANNNLASNAVTALRAEKAFVDKDYTAFTALYDDAELDRLPEAVKVYYQFRRAQASYFLGSDEEATELLEHVFRKLDIKGTPHFVEARLLLAEIQERRGEAEKAQKTLGAARKHASTRNRKDLANAERATAYFLFRRGKYKGAIQHFENADLLFRELDSMSDAARCQLNIAAAYSNLGNYTEAEQIWANLKKLCEELNLIYLAALVNRAVAIHLLNSGYSARASRQFERVLNVINPDKSARQYTITILHYCLSLIQSNDSKRFEESFFKCPVDLRQNAPMLYYRVLLEFHCLRGDFDKAKSLVAQAIQVETTEFVERALFLLSAAKLYVLFDPEESERLLQDSSHLLEQSGLKFAECLIVKALVLLSKGDCEKALWELNDVTDSEPNHYLLLRRDCLRALALLKSGTEFDADEILENHRSYVETFVEDQWRVVYFSIRFSCHFRVDENAKSEINEVARLLKGSDPEYIKEYCRLLRQQIESGKPVEELPGSNATSRWITLHLPPVGKKHENHGFMLLRDSEVTQISHEELDSIEYDGYRIFVNATNGSVYLDGKEMRDFNQRPTLWKLILELIKVPGRKVTKRRLIEYLWPGEGNSIGIEARLYNTVRRLRNLVEKNASEPQVIMHFDGSYGVSPKFRYGAVYYSNDIEMRLNHRQISLLNFLSTNDRITRRQYAKMMKIGETTAKNDLLALLHANRIQKSGNGPSTSYVLADSQTE
jgi:tetratricopeptide (TPR) repeat protein